MGGTSHADPELYARIRQQEVVTDLGQRALESDDLERLMQEATAYVTETLGNDYCKVLELLPGGEELLLRTGVGWKEGLVGTATVGTERDSQAGHTLISEEPVVVDDLRTETRFSGPDLLVDHDVVSGISVVIGSVENPWGVLGTHTTDRREFTRYDANFVQSVANLLAASIDRAETERQLREREAQLQVAAKAGSIGLWRWDVQNDVVTADAFLAESYGMDPERVAAGTPMESFYESIHEEDTEETWNRLERALETGELEAEFRVRTADGDVMWMAARGEVTYDDAGEPIQLNGAIADVTERKRRERALEESEQRYRDLFTSMTEGYCVIEEVETPPGEPIDFRYVEANPAFTDQSGVDEVVGKTIREIVPDEPEEWFDVYDSVARTGDAIRFERELVTQGRVLQCYAFPVGDRTKSQVGVIFTDITEQTERERELERALDLLDRTQHIADVGGWEIDPETLEVFWTDYVFELLEVPTDEEPPLANALEMYVEDDQPIVERAIENALESGESFDVEARIHSHSGDVRWLRLQGVPEVNDGAVVSLRGAAQNVTSHKARERRLEELIAKLEESNERLEQFAYAASHDLQEPLRMVSSYLSLIERRYGDKLDEDGQEFIEFAVDGASRMREMIDGLLEYSRIDTKGGDFAPTDCDHVLAEVLDNLQLSIAETDADVVADPLPTVCGDEGQLVQLVQNLVSNAIKYRGDEPPEVRLSVDRDGDEWVFSVSDNGIGIDPDNQQRVFEVFQRLHTSTEFSGTGIGLALCQRIVERHGGRIWVESEPGEGSTFYFTLPVAGEHRD